MTISYCEAGNYRSCAVNRSLVLGGNRLDAHGPIRFCRIPLPSADSGRRGVMGSAAGHRPASLVRRFVIAGSIALSGLLFFGLEGLGCLAMAAPLVLPTSGIRELAGLSRQRVTDPFIAARP